MSVTTTFSVGARARWRATGETGVILDVDGVFRRVALPEGEQFIHVDELDPVALDPLSDLVSGTVGEHDAFCLRLRALILKHAYRFDPRAGLSNARIELQLHQIYVAHRVVMSKLRPRMVLADEVGLGKTIEAGLIVKELVARRLVERVLIVCPASLQYQWKQELERKFNLPFTIVDGAAVKFLQKDGGNPWSKVDRVICSISFAASPKQADRIIEADWEMVIFDEAHRVRRTYRGPGRYDVTRAYALADELKEAVYGLLLLTATPMQLHPFELYSLIELVEPGLYGSFQEYEQRRQELPALNALMRLLQGWSSYDARERDAKLAEHRRILGVLRVPNAASPLALHDLQARQRVIEEVTERHPLATALVRNRKTEVGGFTTRHAVRKIVELNTAEMELYEDVTTYIRDVYGWAQANKNMAVGFLMATYQKMLTSSSQAIRISLEKRVARLRTGADKAQSARQSGVESDLDDPYELSATAEALESLSWSADGTLAELTHLEGLIERLRRVRDSKADVLVNEVVGPLFDSDPDGRLLIFTQFIETQAYLSNVLRVLGFSSCSFNGRMSAEEKEDAIHRFKTDVPILISTEAGGEGRNLQFCHHMVNYDLPWNPMKVEQRIGRVDRIGQKHPVHIYNLAAGNTIEERVLDVLEKRIRLFEESVGSLDPILGDVERSFQRLVLSADQQTSPFDAYADDLERKVRAARETERTMQDFILDQASLRRDIADQLLERAALAGSRDLAEYMADALPFFGGTLHEHVEGGLEAALSPRLQTRTGSRLGRFHGVFDPQQATDREELDFFAFGHPLVDSIVELALANSPPATGAYVDSDLPDALAIEVLYEVQSRGFRPEGLLIRHRVNERMEVTSNELAAVPLLRAPAWSVTVPSWAASAADRSRAAFRSEFTAQRTRLHAAHGNVRDQELARATRISAYRRDRLNVRIADQARWIADKEQNGSDRDKRILPARRGKLAKERASVERLEFEHDQEIARIHALEPGVQYTILAAALVVQS